MFDALSDSFAFARTHANTFASLTTQSLRHMLAHSAMPFAMLTCKSTTPR